MKKGLLTLLLLITTAMPAMATTDTSGPWGIDASGFRNLSTALAASATAGKTVVISKPMTINNKTTSRAITITAGGSVTVAGGKTFNINGPFDGDKNKLVGTVNFGMSGEKLLNSKLSVGNRAGATNSFDSVILASRTVDDTVSGNGHCFSDSSLVTRGGNMAYAAYDARFTVTGTEAYNHFAPFQNGMIYGSSGVLGYMYGYVDVPQMTAGAVSYRFGVKVADIVKTGGTLNHNYGIWVDELTAGGDNYAIRTVGSTPSLFDGKVTANGGLKVTSSPSVAPLTITGDVSTSGSLVNGINYTITAYVAGDDFSNIASVVSGTINTTGCVFTATGTTPTTWTNSTVITAHAGQSNINGPVAVKGLLISGYMGDTSSTGTANLSVSPVTGFTLRPYSGSTYDAAMMNVGSSAYVWRIPHGTNDFAIVGKSGFNGTAPITKPTVTGSRGGNAALASLITALANYGLIVDSTSP